MKSSSAMLVYFPWCLGKQSYYVNRSLRVFIPNIIQATKSALNYWLPINMYMCMYVPKLSLITDDLKQVLTLHICTVGRLRYTTMRHSIIMYITSTF